MDKILKKLKLRDERTFEKFFEEYKNLVFYQCMSILHNREDAEDILQESFVEFFNKVGSLSDDADVKVTLLNIAKYRALDLYRKHQREQTSYSEDMDIYGKEDKSPDTLVTTLNNLLTPIEADIVVKKIVYELTFMEIADSIYQTLGQTQAIYYKALPKLKTYYKEKK